MSKHKVLLIGATGETGQSILTGLLEDGNFDITCFIQPSSAKKPSVQDLRNRGLKTTNGDLKGPISDLVQVVTGYDIIISAITATAQHEQLALVDAAAIAGIKRFVPCAFTTICAPGGIMGLRDAKEEVYHRIWYHHLPYTIIDVGYWYQISWPRLSSGGTDYAVVIPRNFVYADGETKNLLTHKDDIGRFVARIVRDERTLNQKVACWGDSLSQNEIVKIMEEKSGEKIETSHVSAEELLQERKAARQALAADATEIRNIIAVFQTDYDVSKFLRGDNTLENATYLGYLNGKDLYPDFQPITFQSFVDRLLAGEERRPYPQGIVKSR